MNTSLETEYVSLYKYAMKLKQIRLENIIVEDLIEADLSEIVVAVDGHDIPCHDVQQGTYGR